MDKRQDKPRKNQPPQEEDYPFAEGVGDTSIDLLVYAEALERKKKDPTSAFHSF